MLVELVRNLHTGFVSTQYHVVFDDKYETIFNNGMSDEQFDALCNNLFESSCDLYANEEYNSDGNLLYKPPPLDEVWLSEPERRDRQDALEKQRRRCDIFEHERAAESLKDTPSSPADSPPGLIVSDDESSDDESDSGDPLSVFDSGSEGDDIGYSDHPTFETAPDVEILEAPNIPRGRATSLEGASPETGRGPNERSHQLNKDSDTGHDPDGRSRRLKNKPLP